MMEGREGMEGENDDEFTFKDAELCFIPFIYQRSLSRHCRPLASLPPSLLLYLVAEDLLRVPQAHQQGESVLGIGRRQKVQDARERVGEEHGQHILQGGEGGREGGRDRGKYERDCVGLSEALHALAY